MQPPIAKRVPHELRSHDDVRTDEYYWLRNKQDPEVRDYVQAENMYAKQQLAPTEELAGKLFAEMKERVPESDASVPVRYDNEYEYYHRVEAGKQYKIFCRRRIGSKTEEIILDENVLAEGHEFFMLGIFEMTPDNTLLAYGMDTVGSEEFILHIKDLQTGELLSDRLRDLGTTFAWYNDNRTMLYTKRDAILNERYVYRHVLGTPQESDVLVYEEKSDQFGVAVIRSRSERYIFIDSQSKTTTEVRYVVASDLTMEPKLVLPRREGIRYSAHDHGEDLYLLTNEDAQRFRVVRMPINGSHPPHEVIAESERSIDEIDVFASFIALQERKEGLPAIRIYDIATATSHDVEFPESAYSIFSEPNGMFDTAIYRFGYSSLSTPHTVVAYDITARQWRVLKRRAVGGYDATAYVTERFMVTAPDGVQVPVSLVYKNDGQQVPRPLFLYGYGAYGITVDAGFSDARVSLLDRGFVYAIAHVRGGGELGRQWYEDGKFLQKKHTFTDFIACAEYLIEKGYTTAEQLAICGRSAGGLLIGAVVNMRPELFRCAIAEVPFVDCLTTMLDPNIPLTTCEYEEWGNPSEKDYYDYIKSYTPYDNELIVTSSQKCGNIG